MNVNPSLKSEFLIPGLAILASLLWLVAAASHQLGAALSINQLQQLSAAIGQGPTVVFVVLVVVGAAYTLGIVAVMIMFELLGKRLARRERETRLGQLRKRAVSVGLRDARNDNSRSSLALSRQLDDAFAYGKDYDMDLILSVGRPHLSDGLIREYEYRRSVRQISSGMMLAIPLATVALALTDWGHWTAIPGELWHRELSLPVAVSFGVVAWLILRRTVRYQEEVAQRLLIDAAFMEYLRCKMPLSVLSIFDLESR